MENKILSYRDLEVWKKGMNLSERLYTLTASFPNQELYGLVSQIRRASVSVPSNIAEGYVRNSTKEFIHFLYISLGSLAELDTQLRVAINLGYVKEHTLNETLQLIEVLMKQIRAFINTLKKKI